MSDLSDLSDLRMSDWVGINDGMDQRITREGECLGPSPGKNLTRAPGSRSERLFGAGNGVRFLLLLMFFVRRSARPLRFLPAAGRARILAGSRCRHSATPRNSRGFRGCS